WIAVAAAYLDHITGFHGHRFRNRSKGGILALAVYVDNDTLQREVARTYLGPYLGFYPLCYGQHLFARHKARHPTREPVGGAGKLRHAPRLEVAFNRGANLL